MLDEKFREDLSRSANFAQAFSDSNDAFLVGGQIAGEPPRLFYIDSSGSFVGASERSRFLQLGANM